MGTAPTFAELLGRPEVSERVELGSRFGVMAFHGGLEGGTAEIATQVAEHSGASLYVVVQPRSLRWHVPSALVSPDASSRLACFLSHVDVAVALHGYGRRSRPADLLVGGRNRRLANHIGRYLAASMAGFTVVDDIDAIPVEMRGVHPDNPVNRPRGGGVQLELPHQARGSSAVHRRLGRPAPGLVEGLVAAVTSWVAPPPGHPLPGPADQPVHPMSKLPPDRQ